MFNVLSWFTAVRTQRRPRPLVRRTRLGVESLEERQLLSAVTALPPAAPSAVLTTTLTTATLPAMSMTQLAQQLQIAHLITQPTGPTYLYLNFDGWHNSPYGNIGAFQGTAADRQDILYREAEIFAPFNVVVASLGGDGAHATSGGATTIFVGANGKGGFTPNAFSDYPSVSNPNGGTNHLLNSDPYDLAFVDPNIGSLETSPTPNLALAGRIAHEAGHTFGLAHVRTDGIADYPNNTGDVPSYNSNLPPDVMSYDSNDDYFNIHEFNITDANFVPGQGTIADPSLVPVYKGQNILTQSSLSYLQVVLGARPVASQLGVVDEGVFVLFGSGLKKLDVVDPNMYAQGGNNIQPRPLASGSAVTGTLTQAGDYAAYQINLGASWSFGQMLAITPAVGVRMEMMVYDETNGVAAGTLVASGVGQTLTFVPSAGHVYDLVVGGTSGQTLGAYSFDLGAVVTNVQGASFTVRNAQQGVAGTLTVTSQLENGSFTGTFVPNDGSGTRLPVAGRVGGLVNGASSFRFSGAATTVKVSGTKIVTIVDTTREVNFQGTVVRSGVSIFSTLVLSGQGAYTITVDTDTENTITGASTTSTKVTESLPFVSGSASAPLPVLTLSSVAAPAAQAASSPSDATLAGDFTTTVAGTLGTTRA